MWKLNLFKISNYYYLFITQFCFQDLKDITGKMFMADKDVSDLLVFSPNTDLHHHQLYRSGKIFLQDKVTAVTVNYWSGII